MQSYNRYTYGGNNPLSGVDPSGYSWLGDRWEDLTGSSWSESRDQYIKPIAVAVVSWYTGGVVANSAWATCTVSGAAWGGVAAGAAAGAAGGAMGAALYGGSASDILQGALTGGIAGGIFGGFDYHYGNTWSWERVAANSLAGGVRSTLQGGRFEDGFKMSFITSSARYGWDYARRATDSLKTLACNSGGSGCTYDERGQIRTDGARDVDWSLNPNKEGNWLTKSGMAGEGLGQHWYDPGGALDSKFLRYFVTDVSKMHDWFNSWSYNSANGFYMSRGTGFDSIFQMYSFAGMPVAGALTAVGYLAEMPYNQVAIDVMGRRSR